MTAPMDEREKFLPITRVALIERITRHRAWPADVRHELHRFFHFLDFWRQQTHIARLLDLGRCYEPFNPDSDHLRTRVYTESELAKLKGHVVEGLRALLVQSNYVELDREQLSRALSLDSSYGLELDVDVTAFDEFVVFYRGRVFETQYRRRLRTLYLRKEAYSVPTYQRLFLLLKLKPVDQHIETVMEQRGLKRRTAERHVRRSRSGLQGSMQEKLIYIKLFKNIPRTDLKMCFPNTTLRLRMFDKLKLGASAGSGVGMGVFSTLGQIFAAANPIALAGAAMGFVGVAARQLSNFLHQRQRYMATMAKNLYFHSMADNQGVLTLLADMAAEQDVKEEILLYAAVVGRDVSRAKLPDLDRDIEAWLRGEFNVDPDLEIDEALERLLADRILTENEEGVISALPPDKAAEMIDRHWDNYLNNLVTIDHVEGREVTAAEAATRGGNAD